MDWEKVFEKVIFVTFGVAARRAASAGKTSVGNQTSDLLENYCHESKSH